MSGDDLGDAIKAAVEAVGTPSAANMQAIYRAIGGAIVAHIQARDITTTGEVTAKSGASSVGLSTHTHSSGSPPDAGT